MLCITVAQDGSGDFASISEAVLAVPYDCPAQIRIGAGIYREKLVCEKKDIALQGPGRTAPGSCGGTAASCPTRMGGPPIPSAATRRFSAVSGCGWKI